MEAFRYTYGDAFIYLFVCLFCLPLFFVLGIVSQVISYWTQ